MINSEEFNALHTSHCFYTNVEQKCSLFFVLLNVIITSFVLKVSLGRCTSGLYAVSFLAEITATAVVSSAVFILGLGVQFWVNRRGLCQHPTQQGFCVQECGGGLVAHTHLCSVYEKAQDPWAQQTTSAHNVPFVSFVMLSGSSRCVRVESC